MAFRPHTLLVRSRRLAAGLALAIGLGIGGAQALPFADVGPQAEFVPVYDHDGYGHRGYDRGHHHRGHDRGWGGHHRGWDHDRGYGRRHWGHHHHHHHDGRGRGYGRY